MQFPCTHHLALVPPTLTPEAQEIFGATYDEPDHLWLRVHFTKSEKSQAAGRDFLKRLRLRAENCDPEVNEKVAPARRLARRQAIRTWPPCANCPSCQSAAAGEH
jgi:hypothetical protein